MVIIVGSLVFSGCGNSSESSKPSDSKNKPSKTGLIVDVKGDKYKTIQDAIDSAKAGDTVFVKAGVYHERLEVPNSGKDGARIVIKGERGANGERLVTIDGGDLVDATWEKFGDYAYKTNDISYASYAMAVDIDGVPKDIPRLKWYANEVLNYAVDKNVTLKFFKDRIKREVNEENFKKIYKDVNISYWDGVEALYAYDDATNTTYIRFRNGDNPNTMKLYSSDGHPNQYDSSGVKDVKNLPMDESAVIKIANKSYITIKGFKIDNAQNGVLIYGKDASNNIIEDNEIINGQRRVSVSRLAHDNEIKNNILHTGLLSSDYRPMAWWDWWRLAKSGELSIADQRKRAVAEHIYEVYKREIGVGTFSPISSCGVFVDTAGANNEIHNNEIYDLLGGVLGAQEGSIKIHDNYIHHIASVATGLVDLDDDLNYIYKNRLEDVHIGFRVQLNVSKTNLYALAKESYFFENIVKNPHGIGSSTLIYREKNGTQPQKPEQYPKLFIYHNTFIGTGGDNQYLDYELGKDIHFINNIFADTRMHEYGDKFATVSYNWFNTDNSYVDKGNQIEIDKKLWDIDSIDFSNFLPSTLKVPINSKAHATGIDVSKPFEIDGVSFEPLPFMKEGYFSGNKPDIGAIQ